MASESYNLIETNALSVYQQDDCILNNININIGIGEFVYIVGKVGSGKSSFLKTLFCELAIQDGNATVAGYDLQTIKNSEIPFLRRKIGMVFQDIELLTDRNVYENLKFVLKATGWKKTKEIKQRILEVLEVVDMREKIYFFPKQLSGGEKQALNIARAILNNPPLIFADEPTTNLDPESADSIMSLLYNLSKTGIAIVIVTHNYSLLDKYQGRVLQCKDGKIFEL